MARSLPTAKPAPGPLAALAWWLLALHLALAPLVFCVHTAEVFEENKVALLKLVAWALTGIGLSAWLGGRRGFRDLLGRNLLGAGVGLFLISAVVSTWFSVSPLTSWRGAFESGGGLQTILGYGVLFAATRAVCRTTACGWRLLTAPVFATAVACAHALLQIAGYDPIAWDGVSQFAGHTRPFATLAHANNLGAYLVLTIPLVAAFAHRAFQERRWFAALTTSILGVVAAGVVFVTLSRAAWAGLGIALTLLVAGWVISSARRGGLVIAGTALLCLVVGVGGTLLGWFGPSFDDSVRERLAHVDDGSGRWEIWRAAAEMVREHPLTGTGLDTFRLSFGAHRTTAYWHQEGDTTPARAHNEVLHVLATQGSLGGIAVLVLLGGLGVCGLRAWRRAGPTDRPLVTAVLAGLAGFLVTELTGFTVVGCGGLVVCCSALLSRWQEANGSLAPTVSGGRLWGRWPLVAAAFVGLLYLVNMGWGHVLLCLGLGCCGLPFAFPLCQDAETAGAGRTVPVGGCGGVGVWGWVFHLGLGAAIVALTVGNVWYPFEASWACACGDRLLDDDPTAARSHFERAVAWDPSGDLYRVKLSAALQLCARQASSSAEQLRDRKLAREQLEQAVALVPMDAYHHANLAKLLDDTAYADPVKREPGRDEWDRALQMDQNNIVFIAEAARGALALGEWDRARHLAGKGQELYPDHPLFGAQLAAGALAQGRLTEAAQRYQAVIHADWHGDVEDEARAYAALATCHLGLGHAEYGRDLARHAFALQPQWPTAALLLAQALERLGDSAAAYRTYQQVLAIAPRDPTALAALQRLENQPLAAGSRVP